MNLVTGQLVSGYVAQITALTSSIAATQAAIASGAPLVNLQLTGLTAIDLSQIGLTANQTATILNSLLTFLANLQTTATANLAAVP